MTIALKDSVWADKDFWREQHAKWEEFERKRAKEWAEFVERMAARQAQCDTEPKNTT